MRLDMEPTTVEQLLVVAERVLSDSTHLFEDHDHRREAEDLLAHVLGVEPGELEEAGVIPRRLRDRYLALVARRAAGEPFPLLVGHITFWGLDLRVRPGTFMPRPSSELTVARALKRLRGRRRPVVVDLATGSGPIAIAIAHDRPDARVHGADIDARMLALARRNARELGVTNVSFHRGDLYAALPRSLAGTVDVITGHIPYVPPDEIHDLPSEVIEHEPVFTLSDESADGLSLMRRAIAGAQDWLEPGGWLLLEVSEDLGRRIRSICRRVGLEDHGTATDADRLSVVVEARRPRSSQKLENNRRRP